MVIEGFISFTGHKRPGNSVYCPSFPTHSLLHCSALLGATWSRSVSKTHLHFNKLNILTHLQVGSLPTYLVFSSFIKSKYIVSADFIFNTITAGDSVMCSVRFLPHVAFWAQRPQSSTLSHLPRAPYSNYLFLLSRGYYRRNCKLDFLCLSSC